MGSGHLRTVNPNVCDLLRAKSQWLSKLRTTTVHDLQTIQRYVLYNGQIVFFFLGSTMTLLAFSVRLQQNRTPASCVFSDKDENGGKFKFATLQLIFDRTNHGID